MALATANCPEAGQIVHVVTDHSSYLRPHTARLPRRAIHVGVVTHVSEEGLGFEMSTGKTAGLVLREILMKNVAAIQALDGNYSLGGHLTGVAEAEARSKEAARKKTTCEKREGMYC